MPSTSEVEVDASALIDERTHFASALLIGSFKLREGGNIEIESSSAYGAAILMPQLARTAHWPAYLTFLSIRSYIFLFLNICIQFCLLQLISREEEVMNIFSGQMYLCNFASGVRGPSGTMTTPARTYPFDQWITRNFVKDALKNVFPHKAAAINEHVDPGEYALQSYACRWVCCYIFVMATINELDLIVQMARMLWVVPTRAESWLSLNIDEDDPITNDKNWLDAVDIKIAGIPRVWKLVYFLLALLPKGLIWKLCIETGIGYLMDTSTIEDMIINSVAMAFILNIDEMICSTLMSESTQEMLKKCEGFRLYDRLTEVGMRPDEILNQFGERQRFNNIRWYDMTMLIPWKAVNTFFVTLLFVCLYYRRHCEFVDGNLVSKPMHTPLSSDYSFLRTVFPNLFDGEVEAEPFWRMPEL